MNEGFDQFIDHLIAGGLFLEQAVELVEKAMIERVLRHCSGNRSEASKALGIHRNTLQRKMAEYEIGGRNPRRKSPARGGRAANKPMARGRAAS